MKEGGYWSGHVIALPDRPSVKDSLELRYVQGIADGDWVPWRMSDEESSPWLGSDEEDLDPWVYYR